MSGMDPDSPPGSWISGVDIDSDVEMELESDKVHADDFVIPMLTKERGQLEGLVRDRWHESITEARTGDVRTLQALSAYTSSLPANETLNFCEVLCFHLSKAAPADEASEDITPSEQLAVVSIRGLACLLHDSVGEDVLVDQTRKSWNDIARWLIFFRHKFLHRSPLRSQYLAISMAFLLVVVTRFDGLLELICSNFEILELLAFLWSDSRGLDIDSLGYVSRAISHCKVNPKARKMLIELVMREDMGAPVISLKLHGRIMWAANDPDWVALDAYSRLLMFFSHPPPETPGHIQNQFAIDEEIYDLVQASHRTLIESFPPPENDYYRSACLTMFNFITYFIYTLEQPHGPILAGRIIVGGLLKTLVEFYPLLIIEPLKSSFSRAVADLMTDTLPRYLGIYSKLDMFRKGYLEACSGEARKKMEGGSMIKAWRKFEGLLFERLAYKALFDDGQDNVKPPIRCGNPSCSSLEGSVSFKMCSGCKAELYCSKKCQLTAWKYKGHKQSCKTKVRDAKDKKDEEFMRYCIRRDVVRHLPGLRKLAKHALPNAEFNLVGVGIDYTKLPHKFEVFRLKSLLDQIAKHDPKLEVLLKMLIREAGKNKDKPGTVFAYVTLPEGKGHTKKVYEEVPIETADEFTVTTIGEKPARHTIKRPIGQFGTGKYLKVVAFDKTDQYIAEKLEGMTCRDPA